MEMISRTLYEGFLRFGDSGTFVSSNIFFIVRSIGWDVDPISPATEDFIAVKSPTFHPKPFIIHCYIDLVALG